MSPRAAAERGEIPAPDDPRLGAWRAFLEAHARVTRQLEAELAAETSLSLADYDALASLARAGGRLRMGDLAEQVLLSRSGVTRLVDRLEGEGLVGRRTCAEDHRGAEAFLTHEGIARLRAAMPIHLRGIEAHFLGRIEPGELVCLEAVLHAVAAAQDAPPAYEGSHEAGGTAGRRGAAGSTSR